MQAIRKILNRGDFSGISIPESFGEKVEVIILPLSGAAPSDVGGESEEMMAQQEKTGFAAQVLAVPAEDVWNDL